MAAGSFTKVKIHQHSDLFLHLTAKDQVKSAMLSSLQGPDFWQPCTFALGKASIVDHVGQCVRKVQCSKDESLVQLTL